MILNGETIALDKPCSLADFLENHGYPMTQIAVELNGEIISKNSYVSVQLKEEDSLEVVSFVGGG